MKKNIHYSMPIPANLAFNGWAGFRKIPVLVVGETPKKYRIETVDRMRLAGRNRWLDKGKRALVPKSAILDLPVGE